VCLRTEHFEAEDLHFSELCSISVTLELCSALAVDSIVLLCCWLDAWKGIFAVENCTSGSPLEVL